MFIAKDGFLLYYGEKMNPNSSHFDTKPKVRSPLELEEGVEESTFAWLQLYPSPTATSVLAF